MRSKVALILAMGALVGCGGGGGGTAGTAGPAAHSTRTPVPRDSVSVTLRSAKGLVELRGVGVAEFPLGSFSGAASVTLSRTRDREIASIFHDSTALFGVELVAPDELAITVSGASFEGDAFSVALRVPETLLQASANGGVLAAFGLNRFVSEDDEAGESLDDFETIASTFDASTDTIIAEVPAPFFFETGDGSTRAIIKLGVVRPPVAAAERAVTGPGFLLNPLGVKPLEIVAPYGEPARCGHTTTAPYHRGIDFRANIGTPVYAVASGWIETVAVQDCCKNPALPRCTDATDTTGDFAVTVRHHDGSGAVYRHLKRGSVGPIPLVFTDNEACWSQPPVQPGGLYRYPVAAGQPLAASGETGAHGKPHLHFEYAAAGSANVKTNRIDALTFLGRFHAEEVDTGSDPISEADVAIGENCAPRVVRTSLRSSDGAEITVRRRKKPSELFKPVTAEGCGFQDCSDTKTLARDVRALSADVASFEPLMFTASGRPTERTCSGSVDELLSDEGQFAVAPGASWGATDLEITATTYAQQELDCATCRVVAAKLSVDNACRSGGCPDMVWPEPTPVPGQLSGLNVEFDRSHWRNGDVVRMTVSLEGPPLEQSDLALLLTYPNGVYLHVAESSPGPGLHWGLCDNCYRVQTAYSPPNYWPPVQPGELATFVFEVPCRFSNNWAEGCRLAGASTPICSHPPCTEAPWLSDGGVHLLGWTVESDFDNGCIDNRDVQGPWLFDDPVSGWRTYAIFVNGVAYGFVGEVGGFCHSGGRYTVGNGYQVTADRTIAVTLNDDCSKGQTNLSGELADPDRGVLNGQPFRRVVDEAACQGTWEGVFESGSTQHRAGFSVDAGGNISSPTGELTEVSPHRGHMYADQGDVVGFIWGTDFKLQIAGTLRGDTVRGRWEARTSDPTEAGAFVLRRLP